MEAINYESMKTNEPTRNFDSVDITNDYNVAAQNAQGLYGAFKFFHGIKSFFKGISALGTLATTSKIPVTDNDGNVTYTTPTAIKTALSLVDTTALNGALADYTDLGISSNSNYTISENSYLIQKNGIISGYMEVTVVNSATSFNTLKTLPSPIKQTYITRTDKDGILMRVGSNGALQIAFGTVGTTYYIRFEYPIKKTS